MDIRKLCIESPSYMWHLIETKAMDEMFINYSMVFAGGPLAMGVQRPFSATDHPHSELLLLAAHRNNFIFTRQRLRY